MKIFVIGNIGAGKSTVAKMLATKLNYKYISLDELGHKALEENHDVIEKTFGQFSNREELAKLVLDRTDKLNEIMHPLIYKKMQEELVADCVVEETVYDDEFISKADMVVCVSADLETRKARSTNKQFDKINSIQRQDLEQLSDKIIFNNGGIDQLEDQINELV